MKEHNLEFYETSLRWSGWYKLCCVLCEREAARKQLLYSLSNIFLETSIQKNVRRWCGARNERLWRKRRLGKSWIGIVFLSFKWFLLATALFRHVSKPHQRGALQSPAPLAELNRNMSYRLSRCSSSFFSSFYLFTSRSFSFLAAPVMYEIRKNFVISIS